MASNVRHSAAIWPHSHPGPRRDGCNRDIGHAGPEPEPGRASLIRLMPRSLGVMCKIPPLKFLKPPGRERCATPPLCKSFRSNPLSSSWESIARQSRRLLVLSRPPYPTRVFLFLNTQKQPACPQCLLTVPTPLARPAPRRPSALRTPLSTSTSTSAVMVCRSPSSWTRARTEA